MHMNKIITARQLIAQLENYDIVMSHFYGVFLGMISNFQTVGHSVTTINNNPSPQNQQNLYPIHANYPTYPENNNNNTHHLTQPPENQK